MEIAIWEGGRDAEPTIHRSKAVGEPPLMLAISVFFAIRDAVSAAGGHRLDPPLTAPATSEAILRALTAVQVGRGVIDRAVRDLAVAWQREERAAVVVEVVQTQGSAPRERGARMLVSADQAIGTIGGGHLELKAIAEARSLLARAHASERSATTRSDLL